MCWRKGKCSILGRFLLSEKTQASPKTSTFLQALREQKEQSAPQVKARKDGDCRTSRQPHGTWARPVQQSSNNHKSSPRSVQEAQPDFFKVKSRPAHHTTQPQSKAEPIYHSQAKEQSGCVGGGPRWGCSGQLQPIRSAGAWEQLALGTRQYLVSPFPMYRPWVMFHGCCSSEFFT